MSITRRTADFIFVLSVIYRAISHQGVLFVMMTQDMQNKLRLSLIKHEGYRDRPYVDHRGNITIGIGYNLALRGIPRSCINDQFWKDCGYFYDQLSEYDWFNRLNDDRKVVLIDMAYNLGLLNFLEFKRMIGALQIEDYETAASEMLNSNWATQVKGRAEELATAMRMGIYDI